MGIGKSALATLTGGRKLLVTGASGFIGTHIVERAIKKGYAVSALSLSGKIQDRLAVDRVIRADMSKQDELATELFKDRFDYVVNCAGYVDHRKYLNGGREALDSHFHGLTNLLSVLDNRSIRGFIQMGSSDEYGSNPAPQSESMREAPISPYSCAKVAAAHFLQMRNRTEGFPAVILRLFLVYGPGQERARFLPQIISGCLKNEEFLVSKGEQKRDFCYVDDVVEGVFRAFESDKAKGEVINLASGRALTVRNVISRVVSMTGGGRPLYGKVPYREGENMSLFADIDKSYDLLGWRPKTDIDSGLSKTIAWYRSQEGESA